MSSLGRALTSFIRGACDVLITSSYKKRFLTPSPRSFAISKLVQAQRCPVVRLGRVLIDWLNKASFGPGCELGSRTSAGSYIVEFDVPAYLGLYLSFPVFIPKPRPKA